MKQNWDPSDLGLNLLVFWDVSTPKLLGLLSGPFKGNGRDCVSLLDGCSQDGSSGVEGPMQGGRVLCGNVTEWIEDVGFHDLAKEDLS